jgi:hypothetical protein
MEKTKNSLSTIIKKRTAFSNHKSNNNTSMQIDKGFTFKDVSDLQKEYEKVLDIIANDTGEKISSIINNSDLKYYLINNDLDYILFTLCLKIQKNEYIE